MAKLGRIPLPFRGATDGRGTQWALGGAATPAAVALETVDSYCQSTKMTETTAMTANWLPTLIHQALHRRRNA